MAGLVNTGENFWVGKNKIRTPPLGVPGERTAGCKYYCDRQTARTEAGWSAQTRGMLSGNQGTLGVNP